MQYIVSNLEHTSTQEKDFNLEYHQKYLGKQGKVIDHKHNSELFKYHVCLGFDKNEKGNFTDADWFHRSDLSCPSMWGFTKEDVERWKKE